MKTSYISKPIIFLFLGYAVNFFGSGLTLPFLMVYLHTIRHISLTGAGFILSLSNIVGFVAAPVVGGWIDKMGSFRALIAASLLLCAGTVTFAFSTHFYIAVLAAVVTGFGNVGMWTSLSSRLAVLAGKQLRSRLFGVSYAVQNLGLGLGGGVAGLLVRSNAASSFVDIFLMDACTYLLFIPFIFATRHPSDNKVMPSQETEDGTLLEVPEPDAGVKTTAEQSINRSGTGGSGGLRQALRDKSLLFTTVLNLLYVIFGFSQLNSSFTTWTTTGAGAGASIAGLAFFANCIVIAIVQVPVLRWTEGWRRTRLAMTCGLCFAACWGMTILAGRNGGLWTDIWLVLALIVFGVGETFLSPSLVPLVNDLAPDYLRGRYNAVFTISWQAGAAIGPFIAGIGIGRGDGEWLFSILAISCVIPALGTLWMERVIPPTANRSS